MKHTCCDRPAFHRPASRLTRLAQAGLTAGAALLISACATTPPPSDQVAVSKAAVDHAVAAGSVELAPVEMASARQKLDRANLAMVARDYPLALTLAREAQADAQLAEAKAHSTQARKAADELQESSRVLSEELDRKTKP